MVAAEKSSVDGHKDNEKHSEKTAAHRAAICYFVFPAPCIHKVAERDAFDSTLVERFELNVEGFATVVSGIAVVRFCRFDMVQQSACLCMYVLFPLYIFTMYV